MENIVLRPANSNHQEKEDEKSEPLLSKRTVWVNGPVIVGAGPSGLAVGACLREQGVPFVVVDRADCIASLWQKRTYNRLKLHLPKQFCQLPRLAFPEDFPEYPTKKQFISYLENYSEKFQINPQFNESVQSAKYDETVGVWRVKTTVGGSSEEEVEYLCRWLVVATGENAEKVVPEMEGLEEFNGKVMHACDYRSGEEFEGKRVLVVGCGNSGMEVSLDLSNHNALPSLVCRSSVHVLPRQVFGKSTFQVALLLMRWLPLWIVDKLLLILAWLILGHTQTLGLNRPSMGPLELKNTAGKTPVLDIGALARIRSGHIRVVPGVKRFLPDSVELTDGTTMDVDSVILATGYRNNVPYWLGENELFDSNGCPKSTIASRSTGETGIYAVGFTRRGLAGVSSDAVRIAEDIGQVWKEETRQTKLNTPLHRRCISTF